MDKAQEIAFWKKIEQDFYKECCQTFPGNSGVGGNDPQEPDVQISCYPEDIINFMKSKFATSPIPVPSVERIAEVFSKNYATCDDTACNYCSTCAFKTAQAIHTLLTEPKAEKEGQDEKSQFRCRL